MQINLVVSNILLIFVLSIRRYGSTPLAESILHPALYSDTPINTKPHHIGRVQRSIRKFLELLLRAGNYKTFNNRALMYYVGT